MKSPVQIGTIKLISKCSTIASVLLRMFDINYSTYLLLPRLRSWKQMGNNAWPRTATNNIVLIAERFLAWEEKGGETQGKEDLRKDLQGPGFKSVGGKCGGRGGENLKQGKVNIKQANVVGTRQNREGREREGKGEEKRKFVGVQNESLKKEKQCPKFMVGPQGLNNPQGFGSQGLNINPQGLNNPPGSSSQGLIMSSQELSHGYSSQVLNQAFSPEGSEVI
jgi:hypothetical protein